MTVTPDAPQPAVLLFGLADRLREALGADLETDMRIVDEASAPVDLWAVVAAVSVPEDLARARATAPGAALILIHLSREDGVSEPMAADAAAFVFARPPDPRTLADIVRGVMAERRATGEPLLPAPIAREIDGATSLAESAEHLMRGVVASLDAAGAFLWLLDEDEGCLVDANETGRHVPATSGPIGFVARSGRALRLDSHDAWPSSPDGAREGIGQRLLAVPVVVPSGRTAVAVLAAYREPTDIAFDERDERKLTSLADTALVAIARHGRYLSAAGREAVPGSAVGGLFRRQAVEAHARGRRREARPLGGLPRWTRWTFALLNLGFAAGLALAAIGRVDEWISGPAVVRLGDRIDVAAEAQGVVRAVEVAPRQAVAVGQPLVRFASAQEAARLQHLEVELEQRLRQQLRDPSDTGAEAALIQIRTALEDARARLDERILRSPADGRVSDVRLRPGQHVASGEIVVSLVEDEQRRSLIAFLPGHARPQLAAGQTVRVAILGYRDARATAVIDTVGNDVIGPREARQVLGETLADAVPIEGPVVLVRAQLDTTSFESGGRSFSLFDGMQGLAEVRTRSRSILMTLFPGLEAVLPP